MPKEYDFHAMQSIDRFVLDRLSGTEKLAYLHLAHMLRIEQMTSGNLRISNELFKEKDNELMKMAEELGALA